jgi:hypothetical protein
MRTRWGLIAEAGSAQSTPRHPTTATHPGRCTSPAAGVAQARWAKWPCSTVARAAPAHRRSRILRRLKGRSGNGPAQPITLGTVLRDFWRYTGNASRNLSAGCWTGSRPRRPTSSRTSSSVAAIAFTTRPSRRSELATYRPLTASIAHLVPVDRTTETDETPATEQISWPRLWRRLVTHNSLSGSAALFAREGVDPARNVERHRAG